ncbi:lipopolysaccharide-induced tumor necrosis factor-alpha factor homolog [Zeugodacus cucurbitae]|uniref:Lipopolysaccharide-induced tumor necrosis factor-alpha factor homolog n=1 Tax=Zeugodacus cucurbitae TaxID=28588 RepID=A0A0A1XAV4_ZEUCU|nr:lipopolysaccharide-induced tumor necrosis factor-alpha factor homolog [Zeugodacus cucurbitae]
MAHNKHPYDGVQIPLADEMSNASAPPPAYMQTANVTSVQPVSSGAQITAESQMPTFSTIGMNPNPPVGPESTQVRCPQCKCTVKTTVRYRSTTKTHIVCILLSWTCCCCCLPYCMNSCRNANHFCPMCGTFIGTYES